MVSAARIIQLLPRLTFPFSHFLFCTRVRLFLVHSCTVPDLKEKCVSMHQSMRRRRPLTLLVES